MIASFVISMIMKSFRFILLLVTIPFFLIAQNGDIPLGTWRSHYHTGDMLSIDEYEGKLYCASFYAGTTFDLEYNSFSAISKADGFSDTETRVIKYYDKLDLLMIGYKTGNIDIIKDGVIINIGDIARTKNVTLKEIMHINFHGNFAYVSGFFGVSIIDLKKYEIKETITNLQPLSGQFFRVSASVVYHDSLFIASSQGLFSAPINGSKNLLDSKSWFRYSISTGLINNEWPEYLEIHNDTLLCSIGGNTGVFIYQNGRWKITDWRFDVRYMFSLKDKLVFLRTEKYKNVNGSNVLDYDGYLMIIENGKERIIKHPNITRPRGAYQDKNNNIWVADLFGGLVKLTPSADTFNIVNIKPNHPDRFVAFTLSAADNNVYAPFGGYNDRQNAGINNGFGVYDGYGWTNKNNQNITDIEKFPKIQDVSYALKDPLSNTIYFTMYGYGLLEWNKTTDKYKIYNDTNSTLVNSIPNANPYANYTRISFMDFDNTGDLWITNPISIVTDKTCLHVKRRNGTWEAHELRDGLISTVVPRFIVVDDFDNKWVSNVSGGLFVYNDKTQKTRFLNKDKGNGFLPNNSVKTLIEDNKGQIWVGTSEGVAVFSNPADVFSIEDYEATKPFYNRLPLFFDQEINCMAVDAANRKWISTKEGVWLFNEDCTEQILYFNSKNSPLPADNVTYIAVNKVNGEVFFNTDLGIISYRHNATLPQSQYRECNVFPNPVRPGFSGEIGISGLKAGSEIKIVDARGMLVHETKSLGGMASWNGRDYNGNEISTGVYFIFTTDPDGDKQMCKLAIID
jgi:hypothetical protein